jgi:hypothetical protein
VVTPSWVQAGGVACLPVPEEGPPLEDEEEDVNPGDDPYFHDIGDE